MKLAPYSLFTVHYSTLRLVPLSKLNIELSVNMGLAPGSLFKPGLNMGLNVNIRLAPFSLFKSGPNMGLSVNMGLVPC